METSPTTRVETLADFLLARIAEDRAHSFVHVLLCPRTNLDYEFDETIGRDRPYPCTCGYPERIFRESVARRRLVNLHSDLNAEWHDEDDDGAVRAVCAVCHDNWLHDAEAWPCMTLRLLALAYVDHPNYQSEWTV